MPSERVRAILPGDTATTWDAIAPIVNRAALLAMFRAVIAHNRAGGWRRIQPSPPGSTQSGPAHPQT
jgi:hypothetical protein